MNDLDKENQLEAVTPAKQEVFVVATEKQPFVVVEQRHNSESEGTPGQPATLIASIQDHLMQQNRKSLERSLYKESAVKLSVDKEFAYLFEESAGKMRSQPIELPEVPAMVGLTEDEERIAEWLESDQQRTLARLSFGSHLRLMEMLASKVEHLTIVVTNFHVYYSQKLEELNSRRKLPMQWACLSSSLPLDIKSKILEMYELGKLKLLLVTPQLFQNEQYHSFECSLFAVVDVQLYTQYEGQRLLHKIMQKTSPKRMLGCYEHLSQQAIRQLSMSSLPRSFSCEQHSLIKTTAEVKDRTLMTFIERGAFGRTLIIVPSKKVASELTETLSLQSLKTINLADTLPKALVNNFSLPNFLTKQYKNEALLRKLLARTQGFSIIVSTYFEGLRLLPESDLVVMYSMPPLDRYLEVSSLGTRTCGLVCSDDYHSTRNLLSSALLDVGVLDTILTDVLETKPMNRQRKSVRFFSQSLDDLLLKKFSVDKQDYLAGDMKTLKVSNYCAQHEITREQFELVMEALEECKLALRLMRNVSYECWVQESDVQAFRELLPQATLVHNRVNLLNLSNQMNLTTKQLVAMLRKNRIRYSICEEIIPLKVLAGKGATTLELVVGRIRQKVNARLEELDTSFGMFERLAYPNLEFLRRDRAATKKVQFAKCLEAMMEGKLDPAQSLSHLSYDKIHNLREQAYHQKTIELWLASIGAEELGLNSHQVTLFLQGITTPSMERFQSEALFRNYFRYRHEELHELVLRVMQPKKQKTE